MPRQADEQHREELLDRIVLYVLKHGISDLSLRPLARAVKSSPRVLLYYFSSKEAMIVEVLAGARRRQQAAIEQTLQASPQDDLELCWSLWSYMSAAKSIPLFRLFFEVYALSLQDRKRFPHFFESAVGDWLSFLARPRLERGVSKTDARAFATIVLAGFRGFLLDLCATGERTRIDTAVRGWLGSLDAVTFTSKGARI
ncbi:MAG: TetR/AcrR family transcriptional regulator [Candidatus Eremiobacteraeota bacterium]|nr:TetR/AcrR family transcriptional regulator [Candidatus Eremiobacteraeota bacterium]